MTKLKDSTFVWTPEMEAGFGEYMKKRQDEAIAKAVDYSNKRTVGSKIPKRIAESIFDDYSQATIYRGILNDPESLRYHKSVEIELELRNKGVLNNTNRSLFFKEDYFHPTRYALSLYGDDIQNAYNNIEERYKNLENYYIGNVDYFTEKEYEDLGYGYAMNCITSATCNYGDTGSLKGLKEGVVSNEELIKGPEKYGFQKIDRKDRKEGDIVNTEAHGAFLHSGDSVKYSPGGIGNKSYMKNSIGNVLPSMYNVFRFVGTPEDQRQWREDYIREWNERKKNDQEQ